jgi:hypothetical protein
MSLLLFSFTQLLLLFSFTQLLLFSTCGAGVLGAVWDSGQSFSR